MRDQCEPGAAEKPHDRDAGRDEEGETTEAYLGHRLPHRLDADVEQQPDEKRESDQRRGDDTDLH